MSKQIFASETFNKFAQYPITGTLSDSKMFLHQEIRAGMGMIDSFGRLRVSDTETVFDAKQINDNLPLFFDDAEVSGSGTSSTYSQDQAATSIAVATDAAGKRVRQTFRRFNYQPAKGQLWVLTAVMPDQAGIKAGAGYFDDNDGHFFYNNEGAMEIRQRSSVSGSPVDTIIAQADWNIDPLDGTGPSGITLDPTKANVYFGQFEWLGVGSVGFGIYFNFRPILCHIINNENSINSVYMKTPNLPIRYEIESDGTGAVGETASVKCLCSSVMSEGGIQPTGTASYVSNGATAVAAAVAGTVYALVGIRLKTTALGANVFPNNVSVINSTADNYEWLLIVNPTVAGTFTYSDVTNAPYQIAVGVTANTVTGGQVIDGGYVKSSASSGAIEQIVSNQLVIGAKIDGTRDTMVLCARPLANGAQISGAMSLRTQP